MNIRVIAFKDISLSEISLCNLIQQGTSYTPVKIFISLTIFRADMPPFFLVYLSSITYSAVIIKLLYYVCGDCCFDLSGIFGDVLLPSLSFQRSNDNPRVGLTDYGY